MGFLGAIFGRRLAQERPKNKTKPELTREERIEKMPVTADFDIVKKNASDEFSMLGLKLSHRQCRGGRSMVKYCGMVYAISCSRCGLEIHLADFSQTEETASMSLIVDGGRMELVAVEAESSDELKISLNVKA